MNNKRKKLNFDLDFLGRDTENTIDTSATIGKNPDTINSKKEDCAYFPNSNNESFPDTLTKNNSKTTNDNIEKQLDSTNSSQYSNNEDDSKGCLITTCVVVALFIAVVGFAIWSEETEKKHQAEIQHLTTIAYNYKKEKNPIYEQTVKELAELTNKDVETIKQELQTRFNNEKEQLLKEIVNEMVESNIANKDKIQQCTKIYFDNSKKDCENRIKELFVDKKREITKKLVDNWKNKTSNYEEDKTKYLKTLFNNDIKQFNKAMDEQLGYKEFTLIEQELPKSGIIHMYSQEEAIAPFKISTQQYLYSYGSYETSDDSKNHYYIKLVNSYTNETVATLFVRSGEEIKVDVPLGSYKVKYATGKKWYGEKDLFGHDTIYSKSDEILNFTRDYYYVNGQSLTLYKVSNGNFTTQTIEAKDF